MTDQLTNSLQNNTLRYGNCWEDADILLQGLQAQKGNRILSIASAGDNSLSLLTTQPEYVVAVDVNPVQLWLTELKVACFKELSHEETLSFLGFTKHNRRRDTMKKLRSALSKEAAVYWDNNLQWIDDGIVHQGKFEKYFQIFSKKVLPWIHNNKKTVALFEPKSDDTQADFYRQHWNIWKWRLLFKIFFSKWVMGKLGRDPEFLRQVQIPVKDYIFQKAEEELSCKKAQDNFILHYNLTGHFGRFLPHYLQPENYDLIRSQIEKIHIERGFAEEMSSKFGRFDRMNLSNIFEYMDTDTFLKTAYSLIEGCHSGGRLQYWNLMVPREISTHFKDTVVSESALSRKLTALDKGFFYNKCIIETVK